MIHFERVFLIFICIFVFTAGMALLGYAPFMFLDDFELAGEVMRIMSGIGFFMGALVGICAAAQLKKKV